MAMCYSRLYFLVWGADVVITFAPFFNERLVKE